MDDEPALLDAVRMIFETEGYQVRCLQSGRQFLDALDPSTEACVILGLCLPDRSGLDIQDTLVDLGIDIPHNFFNLRAAFPRP